MEAAFQKSQFIQKHFTSPVYGTNRYLTSFWDTISKNIEILFNFTLERTDYFLKIRRLKDIIQLTNNCYKAPSTFLENGFLTSVIDIPKSESEVFSDLYLLAFLATKLAVTLYLQQKVFINKFNALTIGQNDNFGSRIK